MMYADRDDRRNIKSVQVKREEELWFQLDQLEDILRRKEIENIQLQEEYRDKIEFYQREIRSLRLANEEEREERIVTFQDQLEKHYQSQESQLSDLKPRKVTFGSDTKYQDDDPNVLRDEKLKLIKALRHWLKSSVGKDRMWLDLEGIDLSQDFKYIKSGLSSNPFVTELNINNTSLSDDHLVLLIQALELNKSITKLRLKENRFSEKNISDLINMLISKNDQITLLDISGYALDKNWWLSLSKFIEKNHNLQSLIIKECIQIYSWDSSKA